MPIAQNLTITYAGLTPDAVSAAIGNDGNNGTNTITFKISRFQGFIDLQEYTLYLKLIAFKVGAECGKILQTDEIILPFTVSSAIITAEWTLPVEWTTVGVFMLQLAFRNPEAIARGTGAAEIQTGTTRVAVNTSIDVTGAISAYNPDILRRLVEKVENLSESAVREAPKDGIIYGRINGSWDNIANQPIDGGTS